MTKRQVLWVLPFALVALIAGAVQLGLFAAPAESSAASGSIELSPPLPVNVLKLEQVESVQQKRTYTGTIRARRRSELGFELSGRISNVLVDEGDTVVVGQVLAELDTQTLSARRDATQASREQAESVLLELVAGPRKEAIQSAKASAAAAESERRVAQLNLERRERLRKANAISDEEYDQASFAVRTANANFEAADQRLNELLAGTRSEKVDAQRSVVASLRASASEVEVAIEKSKLLAPFAGTITRRYLDPGSIAQASVPVVKLVEQDALEAWIGLPVSVANRMKVQTSEVILVQGVGYGAVVNAKIGEIDTATRTQTVVFSINKATDPSEVGIVSGQLCEIEVASSVKGKGFWVPTKALAKGIRGLWSVMLVTKDGEGYRTTKSDVEIVNTQDDQVLVRGTIQEGDSIVVDGLHRIATGQRIAPNGT